MFPGKRCGRMLVAGSDMRNALIISALLASGCDLNAGADSQFAFVIRTDADSCTEFAESVCYYVADVIDDCVVSVTEGWEWVDDQGDVRTLGGCKYGPIARRYPCYAAMERRKKSADPYGESLDVALDECSGYDGWPEQTR